MKFKRGAKISTDDFFYDLTTGGYIKPEKLLRDKKDVEKIKAAIATLKEFEKAAEDQGILEYH